MVEKKQKIETYPRKGIVISAYSGYDTENRKERQLVTLDQAMSLKIDGEIFVNNPTNTYRDSVEYDGLKKVHERIIIRRRERTTDSPNATMWVEETIYILPNSINIVDVEALEN